MQMHTVQSMRSNNLSGTKDSVLLPVASRLDSSVEIILFHVSFNLVTVLK